MISDVPIAKPLSCYLKKRLNDRDVKGAHDCTLLRHNVVQAGEGFQKRSALYACVWTLCESAWESSDYAAACPHVFVCSPCPLHPLLERLPFSWHCCLPSTCRFAVSVWSHVVTGSAPVHLALTFL